LGEGKKLEGNPVKYEVPRTTTVLFQGDSITEASRDYTRDDSLGTGYAIMVANWFSADNTEKKVRFLNRGVAADKIKDLKNRWQKDCLNLEPDIVSILIGINDIVGGHFWKSPTSKKSFEEDYRTILEQTRDIVGAKIVLLTPFMVYRTKPQLVYKIILKQKIDVVKKLSKEFKTLLVPLDRIFEEATRKREPTYWSADGIHPTAMGHSLIAQSWLKSISGSLT
jgi:lysophospholipase L1-like esterase